MRLFVAVEVPEVVRAAVQDAVAPLHSVAPPGVRWVHASRYHLTLTFLGSVEESVVPAVTAALSSAVVGVGPFTLSLDGTVGRFGRRVLWAGVAQSPALAALAASVASAMREIVAFDDEGREFRAHLTLARAGRAGLPEAEAVAGVTVPRLAWDVERVVLLRSAAGYSVIAAAGLDASDA